MGKVLGLALGAGAARGWAHVGVLRGLAEMGLKPDIISGCSVGALVGAAYLVDALDELQAWARTLSPLSAVQHFSVAIGSGGLIRAEAAFDAFAEFDCSIESLVVPFGAVACDLGTGEEVELVSGPLLKAVRASSAIPILLQAIEHEGRWLVDGAVVNPTPVSLARKLGADFVIGVDLNAVPKILTRFDTPPPSVPVPVNKEKYAIDKITKAKSFSEAINFLIRDTRNALDREVARAKSRINARPHLFETGMAVSDIVQMQLGRARAKTEPADIMLEPDMRAALPNAFDRADEFIEIGRQALLEQRGVIEDGLRA